ncbi:MAG: translation elongation factor Ts [Microthrixaceae bacterium]
MSEVTAAAVKSLRDATGAGMLDCKNALVAAEGDRDKAARILREKGLTKVAALEDRENNQGAVAMATDGNNAALVQLKSETDFSAKADDFTSLAQQMADAVLAGGPEAIDSLADAVDSLKIAKRENIEVGAAVRFEAAEGNVLDAYLHVQDGRGVNGVLLELSGTDDAELAHEIALHIAFAKPTAMTRDEIPQDLADKARLSFEDLTRKEGKPEQAVPKIVEGRMASWYSERVLPEQGLFGEKQTVADRLGDARIVRFSQATIGE